VLIRYLDERRPAMDYGSFRALVTVLAGRFWADIEAHHPGIDTLALPPEIADAWKARLMFTSRPSERGRPRKRHLDLLTGVRAFYLDIQEWAMDDATWVPFAAPSPVRKGDTDGMAKLRKQVTAQIHQRIRERLPHLPVLVDTAEARLDTQTRLVAAANATPAGEIFDHAVGGSMLLNYYFVPPLHRFTIAEGNNLLALLVFLAVAVAVSSVVDLAARKTGQAARATAEAEMLSTLAGSVLRGDQALPALLAQVRETFGLSSVALVERAADADQEGAGGADQRGWRVVGSVGPDPCRCPEEADTDLPVSPDLALVLRGRPLAAVDRRILAAFAAQAAVALRQQRLSEAAAEAGPLAEADRTRRALLAAVSHDLRSPLAAASAAVANLSSDEVAWTTDERAELLATAQEALDRLAWLVENLLDMSRLQAGRLSVFPAPVGLDDVIPGVLSDLGAAAHAIVVTVPDDLPLVLADPALLERVIANLLSNAARYAPPEHPPLVAASALGDRVEVRVVDRGPGLSEKDREQVFTPFQRLGDTDNTTGIGLGLALSRGLTEAMGGTLTPEDTPGGGLTMVVTLPAALDGRLPVSAMDEDHRDAGGPDSLAIGHSADVV